MSGVSGVSGVLNEERRSYISLSRDAYSVYMLYTNMDGRRVLVDMSEESVEEYLMRDGIEGDLGFLGFLVDYAYSFGELYYRPSTGEVVVP